MKTFILMWNPAISSYKMEDFRRELEHLKDGYWIDENGDEQWLDMNWSVWEHEKAQDGDRFFMVRVGEGNTGIVMSGVFGGNPYEGEDWSGKGRKTFYMDLYCDSMIDSELAPYISTEELMEKLPGFDWTGGHSGRLLNPELAEKLEILWTEYLYKNYAMFDGKAATRQDSDDSDVNDILASYLARTRGNACEICGYDYSKVWDDTHNRRNSYRLFIPSEEERQDPSDNVWKHIHCICSNCDRMPDDCICPRIGETYREDVEE